MILINSENCLVRGLPYTSHLSCLLESGSTLIVWKWGCINDVNPLKISSGLWGGARQCSEREMGDKTQTNRKISWWTDRQPQGMTFSLHGFPHVSLSHLFSAFCGSHLLNTPSPVSSTDSNNSLENIYLAKVPMSHVVVGCENAQGTEDAVMFFWDAKIQIQLHSQVKKMNCKNGIHHKTDIHSRRNGESDKVISRLLLTIDFYILWFYITVPLLSETWTFYISVFVCDSVKCSMWYNHLLNETTALPVTEPDKLYWYCTQ